MSEEIKLIQPAPVVRDEYGMFQHPDLPDFKEGDVDRCKAWRASAPDGYSRAHAAYLCIGIFNPAREGITVLAARFLPINLFHLLVGYLLHRVSSQVAQILESLVRLILALMPFSVHESSSASN